LASTLWTKKEETWLISYWVYKSPEKIAEKLGRSVGAVKKKMYKLTGSANTGRGLESIHSLSERTGYFEYQIRRAIKHLRVKPVKVGGPVGYQLKDYQVEQILQWLTETDLDEERLRKIRLKDQGLWSKKFTECRDCGTTERPHYGLGLCRPCWNRFTWKRRKNI